MKTVICVKRMLGLVFMLIVVYIINYDCIRLCGCMSAYLIVFLCCNYIQYTGIKILKENEMTRVSADLNSGFTFSRPRVQDYIKFKIKTDSRRPKVRTKREELNEIRLEQSVNPAVKVGHYTRTVSTSTQDAYVWSPTAAAPSDSVYCALCTQWLAYLLTSLITSSSSHGVDGRRPEGLYILKIHFNTFIYTLTLIYNTAVSDANEISFVVINHFLI